jgi:enoyl-CoA hydratase/carnithine racemase
MTRKETTMSTSVLIVEKSDAVAIITLNRPEAMNALSLDLRLAFGKAFRDIQADPANRVAILTGAGRAFCGGMDLKSWPTGHRKPEAAAQQAVGTWPTPWRRLTARSLPR